ncbi:hypothetical protein A9G49_09125 [Aeromonas sp. ANP5]|nr:hypothetical protein A9G04_09390 [Aeromonas sp. ANNP30]OEC65490.1 hypothetical protein A9G49_09125 [Aeromonas sp. ANP5]
MWGNIDVCRQLNGLGSGTHTGKQLRNSCTGRQLVSGMQGFFDLFAATTGERGDFPVIPYAVGTEPEIHYEDS